MMKPMIDDETLDRQLRDAAPYIDDDGFTARVVANLPARQRDPAPLRAAILIGLTALGCAVAYLLTGGGRRLFGQGVVELSNFPIWMLVVFAFGCGLVVGAIAVIFAIRKTPEVHDDLARLRF
jgi:hypothetical protein